MGCAFIPVFADGVYLCEVRGDADDPADITDIDRANARLIAAAPELLEALKALRNRQSLYSGGHDDALVAMADAAIAKAEGRA